MREVIDVIECYGGVKKWIFLESGNLHCVAFGEADDTSKTVEDYINNPENEFVWISYPVRQVIENGKIKYN